MSLPEGDGQIQVSELARDRMTASFNLENGLELVPESGPPMRSCFLTGLRYDAGSLAAPSLTPFGNRERKGRPTAE